MLQVCGRRLPSTGGSTGSTPASEAGGSGRSTSFSLPTPVTGSGGTTPQHMQQASPGATCLAVLLQRCSDKSAVVRAKALSNLATIVTDNLRSDGHSFRQVRDYRSCWPTLHFNVCQLTALHSVPWSVGKCACSETLHKLGQLFTAHPVMLLEC